MDCIKILRLTNIARMQLNRADQYLESGDSTNAIHALEETIRLSQRAIDEHEVKFCSVKSGVSLAAIAAEAEEE